MLKNSSRRPGQISRRSTQTGAKESPGGKGATPNPPKDAYQQEYASDNVITDLVKGLAAAQSTGNTNQEVLNLLQSINEKLQNMQTTQNASQEKQSNSSAPTMKQQLSSQPDNAQATKELQSIFSQLLTGKPGEGFPAQNEAKQNGGQSQGNQSTQGQGTQTQNNRIQAQAASQALAQAQFELSQELEASLQKLKQVIAESENLANRISNLLGSENN